MDNTTPHSSHEYDEKVRRTIPFYEEFHNQTIGLIRAVKPETREWLDTGCGSGFLVQKAIKEFPACKFYLADPAPAMLEQGRIRLKNLDRTRIVFLDTVDTENIPADYENKFEVITAIQSHHYLKQKERIKATERCYALLKSGGIYITFENIKPQSATGIEISLKRWMVFQMSRGRDQKTVTHHRNRFDTAYFPITVKDHLELLKRAGFKMYELFWYSYMQAGFYGIK